MEKFEDSGFCKWVIVALMAESLDMTDDLLDKYGEEGCDLFAEWAVPQVTDEIDDLARDYVMRMVGEKIKELKGI